MRLDAPALSLFVALMGCAARAPSPLPPVHACREGRLPGNCVSIEQAERWVSGPFVVETARPLSRGYAHGQLLTVHTGDHDRAVRLKWKEVAPGPIDAHNGLDDHNVSPRHELAAYALQKWFLEPEEYVVPPIAARCMPIPAHARAFGTPGQASVPGASCVLGLVSVWLEDVDELSGLDRQRFDDDARYRHHVADLNVLTFLIDHRDTKPANFVIARDPRDPRVFSVDNGMSFSGPRTIRDHFISDWAALHVPSVTSETVERLRAITRPQLDALLVVSQFAQRDGQLEPVPAREALSQDTGVRIGDDTLQLGLTSAEIDGVYARMQALLQSVDSGRLGVFETASPRHEHVARASD